MPVRLTKSSTDPNRCEPPAPPAPLAPSVSQSCEQVLQKKNPGRTTSSIDASSHPHLGHLSGVLLFLGLAGPHPRSRKTSRSSVDSRARAIDWPTSSLSPETYRSPSRMEPSASTLQSQSECCTSTPVNRTPRRCASFTSVAGE